MQTNVAQALVIMVAIFIGFAAPIRAPQILWVNMVTSVALGLVISFEPHELDVMQRLPRAVGLPILDAFGVWRVVFSLKAHLDNKYLPLGIGVVVILQLLFTYAPPFQVLFETDAIPLRVWPWLLLGGLVFFLVVEAEKLIIRMRRSSHRATAPVSAPV